MSPLCDANSDGGVLILCPELETQCWCFVEHPIVNQTVHMVTVSFLGTLFECITPDLVVINCCQIEQHLCSLRSYHFWGFDKLSCESFSITSEDEKAGGGEHNSQWVCDNEVWISPPRCPYYSHTICQGASVSGQFANWFFSIDFWQNVSNLEGGREGKHGKIKYNKKGANCPPILVSPDLKYSRFVYRSSWEQVSNHPELAGDSDSHVPTVSYSLPLLFGKQGLS